MDDDFGADDAFLSALAASESSSSAGRGGGGGGPSRSRPAAAPGPGRVQQPFPQKIQQPVPQRLDRPPPPPQNAAAGVKQPTPQALPQRSAGSSILVSPRQKGNPVIACLKSVAWEYSDIPADYGLGLTTCALFLRRVQSTKTSLMKLTIADSTFNDDSLKYHRLHPEYIYTRIRNLQGRYNLRVLLTMVDIPNHEDSLRELSKTSLVNNVTLILCWSAAEAARYLELYKSYEHANYAAIRGVQATSYAEKLVEFVTVPRAVNKADAVALVSTFGSLRNAINADPETIGVIGGWGEKKVKSWCSAVDEPFRVKKAAKRGLLEEEEGHSGEKSGGRRKRNLNGALPLGRVPLREMAGIEASRSQGEASVLSERGSEQPQAKKARLSAADVRQDEDDEDAQLAAAIEESKRMAEAEAEARAREVEGEEEESSSSSRSKTLPTRKDDELGDGIAAALAKLRQGG